MKKSGKPAKHIQEPCVCVCECVLYYQMPLLLAHTHTQKRASRGLLSKGAADH